jgi:hypothetical protein
VVATPGEVVAGVVSPELESSDTGAFELVAENLLGAVPTSGGRVTSAARLFKRLWPLEFS